MNKFRKSLSFQISLITILSYLVMAVVIVVVVYSRFETRMILDYTRMAEGVTQLMANAYDTTKTDEYIEKNFSLQEYKDLNKYYYTLKDNYPDIYYMYVYRFEDPTSPTATVIIDLDQEYTDNPPQDSIDWIGDTYEVDEPFASELEAMISGKHPIVHTVHTQDNEYLLSFVRPILDSEGNYVCSACVDFSMDFLHQQDVNFMFRLMSILGVMILIILFFTLRWISIKVTTPLDSISHCIDGFVYETEADRFNNVNNLEALNIPQDNEIGKVFNSFVANMKESLFYMSNYNKAKDEIVDKEKEIKEISIMTYVDGLTQAKNKAAYLKADEELQQGIANGKTDIGILMVDVNDLKYVNDTFGHEAGDKYLQGCCKILCDIYKRSPVFRIGGDEFLVVLQSADYSKRAKLYQETKNCFTKAHNDTEREPWERYSASIGMAIYQDGDTVGDIVKRADKAMYDHKMAYKKQNGSYR